MPFSSVKTVVVIGLAFGFCRDGHAAQLFTRRRFYGPREYRPAACGFYRRRRETISVANATPATASVPANKRLRIFMALLLANEWTSINRACDPRLANFVRRWFWYGL